MNLGAEYKNFLIFITVLIWSDEDCTTNLSSSHQIYPRRSGLVTELIAAVGTRLSADATLKCKNSQCDVVSSSNGTERLTTADILEVFIFNLPLFPGKLVFKTDFIEDWPQVFLDFKLLVEFDGSLFFLFALLLAFLWEQIIKGTWWSYMKGNQGNIKEVHMPMASFWNISPLALLLSRALCETNIASIASILLKGFCLLINQEKDECLL